MIAAGMSYLIFQEIWSEDLCVWNSLNLVVGRSQCSADSYVENRTSISLLVSEIQVFEYFQDGGPIWPPIFGTVVSLLFVGR